jgi:hypothetical protein
MPQKLRKTIKAVCSDMYDGFIYAAKEVLGKKVKLETVVRIPEFSMAPEGLLSYSSLQFPETD